MEVTSTASQASLHLPISLAFNGLERRGLIFKPSLSIRLFFFFPKSLIRNSRQLPKLPRLDQRPSHSIWRRGVALGPRTRLSGYLQLVRRPESQGFTWGGAVTISACKPSLPQSIRTANMGETFTSVCQG